MQVLHSEYVHVKHIYWAAFSQLLHMCQPEKNDNQNIQELRIDTNLEKKS